MAEPSNLLSYQMLANPTTLNYLVDKIYQYCSSADLLTFPKNSPLSSCRLCSHIGPLVLGAGNPTSPLTGRRWSRACPCPTSVSYTHLRAHETGAYL
eukprot:9495570-Pyramimonas_sp.AAC.1